jgi:WD40 repeat protein
VICSRDGKSLASGSRADGTIRLWDVDSRRVRALLHAQEVYGAFSADGKMLASPSDKTVTIWDAVLGEQLATFSGHDDKVWRVAFSPDGKTLASASRARVNLWDLATGDRRVIVDGHPNEIFAITFSPDGKTLAWGGDTAIKLWDLSTGKERASFPVPKWAYYVNQLVFSPDGKTLASTRFFPPIVRVLDLATGQERALGYPAWLDPDAEPLIGPLDLSPDGKTVAAVVEDTIGLWDVASGKNTAAFGPRCHPRPLSLTGLLVPPSLLWAKDAPTVCSVRFTPKGDLLATGRHGRTAMLWTVAKIPSARR